MDKLAYMQLDRIEEKLDILIEASGIELTKKKEESK